MTLPSMTTAGVDMMPSSIISLRSVTFSTAAVPPVYRTAVVTTFSASAHRAQPVPTTLMIMALSLP